MATIILTSTVNVNPQKHFLYQTNKEERLTAYLKSIKQWLEKTKMNIVLVENSGYPFVELEEERIAYKDRFEIISFVESDLPYAGNYFNNHIHIVSKGASELFAINYAYNNSRLIQNANFIIKVTCRYFVPDFEEYLSNIHLNYYDALRQNNKDFCEIVGCHKDKFNIVFMANCINKDGYLNGHVESIYDYRINTLCEKVLICKTFAIEPTQMGGNTVIRSEL
jgi:hypothetical protein